MIWEWLRRLIPRPPERYGADLFAGDDAGAADPASMPLDGVLDLHTFRPRRGVTLLSQS